MLDLQQIKEQYPEQLQGYERAIVREYLQYKILQAIFESNQASQLSFLGGTALRIIHGNNRFSEDIDLDNFGLSWQAFGDVIQKVKQLLVLEGFQVEISMVAKGAFHFNLKFPELLYKQGLSPYQQERILIQVDTIAQGYDYQPEIRIISQKIHTAVHRKRPKGRDFYDITFLFGRAKPDFGYIEQKMGVDSPERLRQEFLLKIEEYDFEALAADVAPFLISKDQVKRVIKFKEFLSQVEMVQ
jgi:hypothetical protein